MTMANGGLHFGFLLDSGQAQFFISVSHPSGKGNMNLFLTFKKEYITTKLSVSANIMTSKKGPRILLT